MKGGDEMNQLKEKSDKELLKLLKGAVVADMVGLGPIFKDLESEVEEEILSRMKIDSQTAATVSRVH